ncbi:hypothetical protein [Saccharospirillum sp.]|uniref:hypothetical protein n=1 Tax=Saccharospirillum sp. TaxID=2033801 RepID=UPI00349FF09F
MNDVRQFELIVSESFDFGALEISRDDEGELQANLEPIADILSASGIEEGLLKNNDVLSTLISTLYDFHLQNGGPADLEIERFRAVEEATQEYGHAGVIGSATLH